MTVKTAISLDNSLFEQIEHFAQELKISRSRFFTLAAQEYIKRLETERMVAALNEVYDGTLDEEDKALLEGYKVHMRRQMEADDESW